MGIDEHIGKWWGRGEAKIRRKGLGGGGIGGERERQRHFDSAILLVEINTTQITLHRSKTIMYKKILTTALSGIAKD